jgi:hypothetical protein
MVEIPRQHAMVVLAALLNAHRQAERDGHLSLVEQLNVATRLCAAAVFFKGEIDE